MKQVNMNIMDNNNFERTLYYWRSTTVAHSMVKTEIDINAGL